MNFCLVRPSQQITGPEFEGIVKTEVVVKTDAPTNNHKRYGGMEEPAPVLSQNQQQRQDPDQAKVGTARHRHRKEYAAGQQPVPDAGPVEAYQAE